MNNDNKIIELEKRLNKSALIIKQLINRIEELEKQMLIVQPYKFVTLSNEKE